jgi:Skp family chaperone for outer membrane proteins
MRTLRSAAVAAILAALATLTANAQQPAATPRPAPAQGAAVAIPDGKFAIIDTEAFGDPKTGIARLVNAFNAVEREFKPRRDEVQQLQARYEQLLKEIDATKGVADQKTLTAKADQAETIEKEIKRKQEDGQRDLERRARALTDPIYQDISNALQAFAKQRGVAVIFDVSKMGQAMFVVNDAVDITDSFIADYNQRNPAPAAPGVK